MPSATQDSPGTTEDNDSALTADDVHHLVDLCASVSQSSQDYSETDQLQCASLQKAEEQLQSIKQQVSASSRTAKLWIQYIRYVDICKLFIMAERTGNWHLHLQAVHDMLNLLAATGHTHYAKCARLYLQMMCSLPIDHPWLYDVFINQGFNSVRRSDRYWSGLSPDLVIEQTMMRTIKGRSGLTRGRGLTDSVRCLWIGTLHHSAAVHLSLSELTGLNPVSQQHVDIGLSRVRRDCSDLQKFLDWLQANDPFSGADSRLRSLSAGLVADEADNLTCDSAEDVGAAIHHRWNDVTFYDLCLKKSDKVTTFKNLQGDSGCQKTKQIQSTTNIFHRILLLAERSADISNYFHYELTPYPMALFKDCSMRKPNKANLAQSLLVGLPSAMWLMVVVCYIS